MDLRPSPVAVSLGTDSDQSSTLPVYLEALSTSLHSRRQTQTRQILSI